MMPVWAGWLMALMGVVVGWIIGHQLGVQWEARRFRRDTEIVLHPSQPATHPALSIQQVMSPLEIGVQNAADMFAVGYVSEMNRPIVDTVVMNRRTAITRLDDQGIDEEFLASMDFAARAFAVGYLAMEHSMGADENGDLSIVMDGMVEVLDDELMDMGMLVAHRVRACRTT